ncbi:hypothetical protein [Halarsenatibacter silvermanii]|uniref:50S ribosomal protein L29 n=1 Tax=Halarsenatibacter silvermanii TaxID=321763 RepID=A0A1G9QX44_9FIRM|nr:hypothetical protein [Halarsenatibacter silvermanii]SDM14795.1 hypothetical protein SAMN04488692_11837 [Halarsenatibacter silvermanii]
MEKEELQKNTLDELEELLNEKQEKYEEIEEERKFVLKQTGRHIPGTTREEYKIELNRIQSQIEKIKEVIEEKKH